MKYKVFVDGSEGTTGLKINERLAGISEIELLKIDNDLRKDSAQRAKMLNSADVAFLCLPDDAAIEAVNLVTNPNTRIIDASTAHRTNPQWAYGFPELGADFEDKIKSSKRIAVPGCYATGFNALIYPLVKQRIMPADYPVVCQATSGYSGGGKKLIARYEAERPAHDELESPQYYALQLAHKHLPEMQKISGLTETPLFFPVVDGYYNGMIVTLPLHARLLLNKVSAEELHGFFSDYYGGQKHIKVMPLGTQILPQSGFLNCTGCNQSNDLEIYVFGNDENILLAARLDNLGKGASGAAVQCMKLMLGLN